MITPSVRRVNLVLPHTARGPARHWARLGAVRRVEVPPRARWAGRPEGVPTPVSSGSPTPTRRTTCPDCRGFRPIQKATTVPVSARRLKVMQRNRLEISWHAGRRP